MTFFLFFKPIYSPIAGEEKRKKQRKKLIRKVVRKTFKKLKVKETFDFNKYMQEETRAVQLIYDRIKEKKRIEEEEIVAVLMELLH